MCLQFLSTHHFSASQLSLLARKLSTFALLHSIFRRKSKTVLLEVTGTSSFSFSWHNPSHILWNSSLLDPRNPSSSVCFDFSCSVCVAFLPPRCGARPLWNEGPQGRREKGKGRYWPFSVSRLALEEKSSSFYSLPWRRKILVPLTCFGEKTRISFLVSFDDFSFSL